MEISILKAKKPMTMYAVCHHDLYADGVLIKEDLTFAKLLKEIMATQKELNEYERERIKWCLLHESCVHVEGVNYEIVETIRKW